MKKIALLAGVVLLFCSNMAMAQKKTPADEGKKTHSQFPSHRCQTMEVYEKAFRANPAYKAQFEANQARLAEKSRTLGSQRTTAMNDTIAVVIHVIGDASMQAQVTDAALQSQIDVLNEDFQGKNADSTRIPAAFKPLYGKMGLTFMLARTSPTSTLTNGIERRTSNATFTAGTADNAKQTSLGGLDAWDPTRYLNLWVVSFSDNILGISVFPGDPKPLNLHGFVCHYRAFGRNANHLYPEFNLGRTTSHELGHFWNLRHIWGDDGGSCSGTDFPGAPAGQDDTPNQASETFGDMDPAGIGAIVTDACTSTGQGIMYQNYMDYSDDIALVMFTKGQVARMETALTTSGDRAGLLSSTAYLPPFAYDASLAILKPGANEVICNTTSVSPVFALINSGVNALTSANFSISLDGGVATSFSWTGNLTTGNRTNISLPSYSGLNYGVHTFNVCITDINGGTTEGDLSNNCQTNSFTILNATTGSLPAPLNEGFENTAFPPAGWTLSSSATNGDWVRSTRAAKTGTASAMVNWYDYAAGTVSNLTTPMINFFGNDAAYLSFHYAYKLYSSAELGDTLDIQVSGDCGTTWTSVWKKGGAQLPTTPGGTLNTDWAPGAAEWTTNPIVVNLSAYVNMPIYVRVRAKSGWGQNLYLDDLKLYGIVYRDNDAGITAINVPSGEICNANVAPQVVVKNFGLLPLTSVTLNASVDGGAVQSQSYPSINLAPFASTTLTMNSISGLAAGAHSLQIYTSQPNAVADEVTTNDSLATSFVTNIATSVFPIVEGFEATEFPTNGWKIINEGNDNITWLRTNVVKKSGNNSAYINNFFYTSLGQLDYLRSPSVNFVGNDTAYMTFHYANKLYSSTADGLGDTLEVMVSTNCGANWTSVWKRGGSQLATTSGTTGNVNWAPSAADWTQTPVSVNLTAYKNSGPLFVAIRAKNGYGQNIFLDDIKIISESIPNYDAAITQILEPYANSCQPTVSPKIKVQNLGQQTLTSLKINYQVNNGPIITQSFTGINLRRDRDTVFTLNASAPQSSGNYVFKFFTSDPNNQADLRVSNDTLSKAVAFRDAITGNMVEGFENTFLPNNWDINQVPADNMTWQKTTKTGRNSNASAWMRSWIYNGANKIDDLITPPLSTGVVDSVTFSFDVAATFTRQQNVRIGRDTLEVLMTLDCGNSFTSIYKKWGNELQTIGDINTAPVFAPTDTLGFVPTASQWRTETINLSPILAQGGMARFVFRTKSNYDNNIFIDNVKFTTRIVPENVKTNGYVVYPNPFSTNVGVWHYEQPQDLRFISVYTTSGSLIWSKQFNGNAEKFVPLDLKNAPAGIYVVRLGYADENKNKSERIIKLQ